tara:strand:- start:317 stop:538 length:222 start_codon:yes stop_codon:yes gene_type:complete
MPKRTKFFSGDLVKDLVSGKHGVVIKFLHTYPVVKSQRTGDNVRDMYEVLLSNGTKAYLKHDVMIRVENADDR